MVKRSKNKIGKFQKGRTMRRAQPQPSGSSSMVRASKLSARRVFAPTSIGAVSGKRRMQFRQVPGGIVISHSEYLCDITAVAAPGTVLQALTIQPGLSNVFTYLSGLAVNFEKYKFRRLAIEFRSVVSASYNGNVVLGIDPDALDPAPLGKEQLYDYEGTVSGNVWTPFVLEYDVGCFAQDFLYVRASPAPNPSDARLYDAGILYALTTGGMAGVGTVGELWATYDIEFRIPQLSLLYNPGILSGSATSTAGTSAAVPMGSAGTTSGITEYYYKPFSTSVDSLFGFEVYNLLNPSQVIVGAPKGGWQLTYDIKGTGLTTVGATVNAVAGCTIGLGNYLVNATATEIFIVLSLTTQSNSGAIFDFELAPGCTVASSNLIVSRY